MKKKIGTLRGKPIVEGDSNLVKKTEINISTIGNNSNSSNSSLFKYYTITIGDLDLDNETVQVMFTLLNYTPVFSVIANNKLINSFSCETYDNGAYSDIDGHMIVSPLYNKAGKLFIDFTTLKGFCLYTGKQYVGISIDKTYTSFNYITLEGDLISQLSILFPNADLSELIESISNMFKEISEEEYLNLIE